MPGVYETPESCGGKVERKDRKSSEPMGKTT